MSAFGAFVGVAGTVASKLFRPDSWTLVNRETGEPLTGDFPHESMTRSVGGNYAQVNSLNRGNPILQFLNGKTDTLSLRGRFRQAHALDNPGPVQKLEKLISWAKIDPIIRRPPVLVFGLGTGAEVAFDVVLEGVEAEYRTATLLGTIREVTFTMNMLRYTGFAIDNTQATDTRYARVRTRDYYEWLAWEEYGDPMIGIVLRQRHPRLLVPVVGDVVKLPSIEGVRTTVPKPTSLVFADAFSRKDTAARRLRIQWVAKRSTNHISYLTKIEV